MRKCCRVVRGGSVNCREGSQGDKCCNRSRMLFDLLGAPFLNNALVLRIMWVLVKMSVKLNDPQDIIYYLLKNVKSVTKRLQIGNSLKDIKVSSVV